MLENQNTEYRKQNRGGRLCGVAFVRWLGRDSGHWREAYDTMNLATRVRQMPSQECRTTRHDDWNLRTASRGPYLTTSPSRNALPGCHPVAGC
jgi:hypothetical protein